MSEAVPDPTDRLWSAFRRLVVATFPSLRFFAPWEYVVAEIDGGNIKAAPSDTTSGMPDVVMPVRSVAGMTVVPAVGSLVIVAFANGDPSRPRAVAFDETPATSVSLSATSTAVAAGYLVCTSAGALLPPSGPSPYSASWYPATPAGLAAAVIAAAGLTPTPGFIVNLGSPP
jgi:hypothetical protein